MAVIATGLFLALSLRNHPSNRLRSEDRRRWKDQAITAIAARASDTSWIQKEIATLRANASNEWMHTDTWLSPALILMTNGDWIAYSNVCNKESRRIQDLFIGRGSDGKWYYSTYHFCINMIVLRLRSEGDGAHSSLAEFSNTYYLRDFDGRSDDCLQKTWPLKRH